MKAKKTNGASKRGPKAERLKLSGDWRDAVKKALKKERPKDRGWPKPGKGE